MRASACHAQCSASIASSTRYWTCRQLLEGLRRKAAESRAAHLWTQSPRWHCLSGRPYRNSGNQFGGTPGQKPFRSRRSPKSRAQFARPKTGRVVRLRINLRTGKSQRNRKPALRIRIFFFFFLLFTFGYRLRKLTTNRRHAEGLIAARGSHNKDDPERPKVACSACQLRNSSTAWCRLHLPISPEGRASENTGRYQPWKVGSCAGAR